MIRCKDCHYRKDNTRLKEKYEEGPCKGQPVVICSKNRNHSDEVQIKTRPCWCPLRNVK